MLVTTSQGVGWTKMKLMLHSTQVEVVNEVGVLSLLPAVIPYFSGCVGGWWVDGEIKIISISSFN